MKFRIVCLCNHELDAITRVALGLPAVVARDCEFAKMPVHEAAKNPFGTMHAGALIWFADVAATLCAIGDSGTVDDQGKGFPLAIDLHSVLVGNESQGMLTATATTTKRGKKPIIIRTEVTGETGRLLIDLTTTHMRAD